MSKDTDEIIQWMTDWEAEKVTKAEYKQWKRNFVFSRSKDQLMDIIEEMNLG